MTVIIPDLHYRWMNSDNPRRLAVVQISNELLQELFTKGYTSRGILECIEGLPEGAIFSHSFTDDLKGTSFLVYLHDSFEPVPVGAVIPVIGVTMKIHYQEEKT